MIQFFGQVFAGMTLLSTAILFFSFGSWAFSPDSEGALAGIRIGLVYTIIFVALTCFCAILA